MDLMYLIPKKSTGLYISSDFIEVAVVKRDLKGIKVEHVIRKNISTQDMDIADQNEIIRSVIDDIFIGYPKYCEDVSNIF